MVFRSFAFDAKKEKKAKQMFPKSKFAASKRIEQEFARNLKKVAKASGSIVNKYVNGSKVQHADAMVSEAISYSRLLTPWAKEQSKILVQETLKRIHSDKAYREHSKKIGQLLSADIFESENTIFIDLLMREQVELIQSIPLEAAYRAQRLALEAVAGGRRADEIASELQQTTSVTENRAKLIARTETARANTALNESRARSVGSDKYIWRTSDDASVRHSHKKMNGRIFKWDNPPSLSDGTTGHPGTFPNCRCYAEPILPDV